MKPQTLSLLMILSGIGLAACSDNATPPASDKTTSSTGMNAMPPVDLALGKQLFLANCAACHGQDAMGTDQGPPLIHDIYKSSHHDDFAFYRAAANGSRQHHWQFGDMPPVSSVRIEDMRHIIAWVRSKQRQAGIE